MSKQIWKGSALLAPVPPVLVSCGTGDSANLITIAWAGTVCTHPPRLSISVRKSRHSYPLICESGEFVVNLPTQKLLGAIDWCGVKSGKDVNKFEAMGLTACPANTISCPVVQESPINLECKVFQQIELGSHDLFLADITAIQVDESLLDENGKLCLDKAGLLAYAHGAYYSLGNQLGTFGYSVRKKKKKRKSHRPQQSKT